MYYGLILNIKQNHGFKPWDGVKKKKKWWIWESLPQN